MENSHSIASETRWSVGLGQGASRVGNDRDTRGGGRNALRRIAGLFEDVALLLLVVLLVPVAILVLGTPLALFVRLLLEIVGRM